MKYTPDEIMKGLDHCYHLSRSYLKEINDGGFDECFDCPFRPDGEDTCDTLEPLFAATIDLLKAQESRVMTLEELEDALDTVVWLDIPNTENLADGYSLIMAYSHKNGFIFLESPFGDNPSQDRFEYKDYGITWRCWTSRPTDEQREAVKWDEPPKEG